MSNMSYCRFRNTLLDLQDCAAELERLALFADADSYCPSCDGDGCEECEQLSLEEHDAKEQLMALMTELVRDFGDVK